MLADNIQINDACVYTQICQQITKMFSLEYLSINESEIKKTIKKKQPSSSSTHPIIFIPRTYITNSIQFQRIKKIINFFFWKNYVI